jgi:hydrogenase/urease accessory protein HupE
LVTAVWADGTTARQFFANSDAGIVVELSQLRAGAGSIGDLARRYLMLGAEHILKGVDHLLFVVGILLLIRGGARLAQTITAFTVAHSLTLGLATFDALRLRQEPVDAIVALSLVFLAVEVVKLQRGQQSLTVRYPWVMALGFGLIHGLGFAGALNGLGLPAQEIPGALLFFNLGIEAGQLAFVGLWLLGMWSARRLHLRIPRQIEWLPPYLLGGISAFWLCERLLRMVLSSTTSTLSL